MKKNLKYLLFSTLLFFGISVVFVACQKSETNLVQTAKNEVKNSDLIARPYSGFNRTLKGCVPDIYCEPPKGDCYDDIVVYGSIDIETFENIFITIDAQNTQNIIDIFQQYRTFLEQYILSQDIDAVINQEMTVEYCYNLSLDTHFVIFKQGNSVIAAYPVKFA